MHFEYNLPLDAPASIERWTFDFKAFKSAANTLDIGSAALRTNKTPKAVEVQACSVNFDLCQLQLGAGWRRLAPSTLTCNNILFCLEKLFLESLGLLMSLPLVNTYNTLFFSPSFVVFCLQVCTLRLHVLLSLCKKFFTHCSAHLWCEGFRFCEIQ